MKTPTIEETSRQAIEYFAGALKPKGKDWQILEINANGSREYHDLFAEGNHYLCMSTLKLGGVDYHVQRMDLSSLIEIEDESMDLVIHSLTLQKTWDFKKALEEAHRIVKQGGFLIVSTPWLSESQGENDYWRFSHHALSRMFDEIGFDHGRVAMWNGIVVSGMVRRGK